MKMKVTRKTNINVRKALLSASKDTVEEITEMVAATSKAYAPVDTGLLRANIFTRISKYVGRIISGVHYAMIQEETANHGEGYLKPAVDFVKTKVGRTFSKNWRSALRIKY